MEGQGNHVAVLGDVDPEAAAHELDAVGLHRGGSERVRGVGERVGEKVRETGGPPWK